MTHRPPWAICERPLAAAGVEVSRGGVPVLRGVDLQLHAGEVVAVLGPNGAGKSTLVLALAGLLETGAGTIERSGRVAAALQSAALARRSVRANVELALAWWGVPRAERAGRAARALEALGIGDLAARRADTLSGGQARRVHLARALAVEPDALLLDEPFAGLDAEARADLLYDAPSVLRAPGRATLVVLHDRAEAWALADRLVVLLDGVVAATGTPAALLEAPPTPAVARFLGFSGEVQEPGGGRRLLRPAQVALDPGGPIAATVTRRVPTEDGVRLELACEGGRLFALAPLDGPQVGAPVRVRLDGGVRFDP